MDFGFSPQFDEHHRRLGQMFARRANTTLIHGHPFNTLRELISHLQTADNVSRPIGDLLIGAHANDEGQLRIPMFPGQQSDDWTLFETLDDTLNQSSSSVAIPDALIGYKPGSPITRSVHIKGCNIGSARPFLVKLKQALGGRVKVTAPKFFHGATPEPAGIFEYVCYQFSLRRKTIFANRAAALAAFDAAQFKLVDGSLVPKDDWKSVVPQNPNREQRAQAPSTLGVTLARRTTVNAPRQYRVEAIEFGIRLSFSGTVPTNKQMQLAELKTQLGNDPTFQTTHPFPRFKREGFADLDEFLAAHDWTCTPNQRTKSLLCIGRRRLYVVVVAVTDPATRPAKGFFGDGNLIFNFYPADGSSLPPITNALQVTDTRFFETV